MSRVGWTLADVEKIGLDRLVRQAPAVKSTQVTQSKYRSTPTKVDGIRFASKKEARRWSELLLLEHAGEVHGLHRQPRFALKVGVEPFTVTLGDYVADFQYSQLGQIVVEDTKGFRTELYRWKKKHFEAQYGIKISEL